MSKTKTFWNKKRLALAAVGLVVVIAAVIAAVALLTGSREMCFRDISDLDPASEAVLQVQNGPSQIPSPFPRYSVTGPEGYTQTQDSSVQPGIPGPLLHPGGGVCGFFPDPCFGPGPDCAVGPGGVRDPAVWGDGSGVLPIGGLAESTFGGADLAEGSH